MSLYKYFWSVAALLSYLILQQADNATGQFTAAPPTCPGNTFTFRCTVGGDNTMLTTWRVGRNSECHLLHRGTTSLSCGPGNAFTATSGTGFGVSTTSFSSTLSVTATPALNGTLIECFGPGSGGDLGNRVGGSAIHVVDPPSLPTLSCVDLSGDVSGSVSVTVSWMLSGENNAESYLISITTNDPQPPYGGLLNITDASVTQRELTGFQAGYEYTITVRGVNCESQVGSESEPLTVTPQVPATPASCVSTAIYNQSSGMLLAIDSIWGTVPDPAELGEVCPDPSGNIIQYQISFQTGLFVNSENVNIAMCAAGRCSHSYELTSNLLNGSVISSIETVSVAAENVVGLGATRTCAARPISITNSVLRVTVANMSSPAETQLQCTLLSGFTGSARCLVQYGTDPTYTNLPYSAESSETGTAGETVSVVLREQLNSSSVYYYTVSIVGGGVTVAVQGSFTTPQRNCYLSALQRPGSLPDDSSYPHCQHNQDTMTTITILNGEIFVTCYFGRQFVSVASYVCSEGYQPNVSSSVRVCRDNGTWSGTTIACDIIQTSPTTLSQGASTWTVVVATGVSALVVGVLTGVLLGVLVYHCISKHRPRSPKSDSSSRQRTGPLYEEVSASSAGEKIELRQNIAYGPVHKLD